MFGWRWIRFKQRVRTLAVAFLATVMSAGFATALVGNATPGNAASIALFSVPLSVLVWVWGFFLSRTWLYGADIAFLSLAPMTPRQFFARKVRYHWVLYAYMLAFVPFFAWAMVAASQPGRPLLYLAGFLAYFVMLLGPAAEGSAGPRPATAVLFIPRHVLRFGLKPAIGVAVLIVAAFLVRPREFAGLVETGVSRLLDLGPAGVLILAALSPASAAGALTPQGAPDTHMIAVCAFFGVLLGWEIFAIGRTVLGSQQDTERGQLEAWLEQRTAWLEAVEQATDVEEKQIEDWTAQRTHARLDEIVPPPLPDAIVDVEAIPVPAIENTTPLAYSPGMSTEAQIIRHAKYALKQVQRPGISGLLGRMTARYWLLTLIVGYQLARLATETNARSLPALIALAVIVFRAVATANTGHWWEPMLRLIMGLPVRVRMLVARAFADRFALDFAIDAACAALAALLSGAPWVVGAMALAALQLIRVSSYLRMWLRLSRGKGKLKDVTLYQGFELALYFVVFMWLVISATGRGARGLNLEPAAYVLILAAGGSVIMTGVMTLWWRYRRADTSHLRNPLATWGE